MITTVIYGTAWQSRVPASLPQDVNGDSILHWAAREVSAAFLRDVLQLARKNGSTVPQLTAVLQASTGRDEDVAL